MMKFGITLPYGPPECPGAADPDFALSVVQRAEQLGFDSVWAGEHVVMVADYKPIYPYAPDGKAPVRLDSVFPEPLIWLSWVAAHTSTIKLGTSVIVLPQRQPVLLAKQAATLDRLSKGRLMLGVGVGWQKEESEALGFSFENRGARTDEFISAMQELWTADESSFNGPNVSFDRVYSYPKPVAHAGVPLIIGGHSAAAARRAGRVGQGMFAMVGAPDAAASARKEMDNAAISANRDPAQLELTVGRPPMDGMTSADYLDEIKSYRDAGADRLVLFRLFDLDPHELIAILETFARDVISKIS